MSRKGREPVFVAEFATRDDAEAAWRSLMEFGVPSTVITADAPWEDARHLLQCARDDAPAALRALSTTDGTEPNAAD